MLVTQQRYVTHSLLNRVA